MGFYSGPSDAEFVGLDDLAQEYLREAWTKYWTEAKKRLARSNCERLSVSDIADAQQMFLGAIYDDSLRRHVAKELLI